MKNTKYKRIQDLERTIWLRDAASVARPVRCRVGAISSAEDFGPELTEVFNSVIEQAGYRIERVTRSTWGLENSLHLCELLGERDAPPMPGV